MASKNPGAGVNGARIGSGMGKPTVTALRRWSILNKQLPDAESIKAIHIYDFDNTLFRTPLPNPKLWNGQTLGSLASPDIFVNGGWWHDSRILAATGEGAEREEARGWDGWWNEKIVELVQLSMKQKDALAVLLTGRSERGFSDLLKRIVASKGLEFDMIGLKPAVGPSNERFSSTMNFKQIFLEAIMETYKAAEEIRIYEDRVKHVQGFRSFMAEYNKRQEGYGGQKTRDPITAEVIQVADISTNLDPVVEVAEIQHLVNSHNTLLAQQGSSRRGGGKKPERLIIKKTVFFTSYMIDKTDTERLLSLVQLPSSGSDLKIHANNIMICPRPCPKSILEKVGGMGGKMKWKVTGIACFENSIWAASVEPVPATAKYHTDNPSPLVVLALRKGARPMDAGRIQNWQPISADKAYVFETVVGEKVLLRIEPEDPDENEYESLFANKSAKRKHTGDEDRPREKHQTDGRGERNFHSGGHGPGRGGNSHRGGGGGGGGNFRGNNTPNRGYRTGGRGGGGGHHKGGGNRGGKGGGHNYRSLDDMGGRDGNGNGQGGFGGAANGGVSYDDSFPSLPPQAPGGFPPQPPVPPPGWNGQPYQQPGGGFPQGRPGAGYGGGGGGGGGQDLGNLY